jgi:hypothetical protein
MTDYGEGRIVSTNTKVKQICGLSLSDLTEWEQEFVDSVADRTKEGTDCSSLTDKQRDIIDRIWKKHFA